MTETTKSKPQTTSLVQVEAGNRGLVLNNLEDMKTVARIIFQSKLAPDSFTTSEQIFIGLQSGAEIGLKPMQSLNSIVIIRGKPTLWGDAALALVKRSGFCEYCNEYLELDGKKTSEKDIQYTDIEEYPDSLVAVCETKRKDDPDPVFRYFSVADAKLAHLWKKGGPWTTHPKRMLKYKARAFNLRDSYPDVLYGMHLTEELYGEEPLPAPQTDVKHRDERRMEVPSKTIDTTRASVEKTKVDIIPEDTVSTEMAGSEKKRDITTEITEEKTEAEPAAAESSIEEKGDVAELYIEVNAAYVALNGQDFIAFASYVLCLDEDEISPSRLTVEQLQQIKAYIETNGIAIN